MSVGAAAVLHMVESVPTGSHLSFVRYFTTVDLMDALLAKASSNWNHNEESSPKAMQARRQAVAKRGEGSISISSEKES